MFSRHGAAEERRLLRDDADLLAERAHLDAAHIQSIDQDAACCYVIEAWDQVDQRGLAGAAGPNQGY